MELKIEQGKWYQAADGRVIQCEGQIFHPGYDVARYRIGGFMYFRDGRCESGSALDIVREISPPERPTTKRDEFAMAALTGLVAGMDEAKPDELLEVPKRLSKWAYMFADEMMKISESS